MRKILALTAIAAVAACSQADEPVEPETTEDAASANIAADGGPSVGMYKVTTSEGEVFTEVLNEDGTYSTTNADGDLVETGTWEQKSPEQYCTTTDEAYRDEDDTGEQGCNTEGINDDGVWFSTNDEGETGTVERVVEEASAE